MPYRVDLSPRAERDLAGLYESINAGDSPAAASWFNSFEKFIYRLEKTPFLGFRTHESQLVRQLIYGKKPHLYRVIYAVSERDQAVTVLHIRHGKRDFFKPADVRS